MVVVHMLSAANDHLTLCGARMRLIFSVSDGTGFGSGYRIMDSIHTSRSMWKT